MCIRDRLSIPHQAIAAPGLFQRLDAQQYILVVIPHRNQVMRIMCHRRGNGSVKEKALCHADAHPTCSSMPLHHRNFLKVPVRLEFSRGTRHLADPVPCQDLMGDHLSHVSRAVGAGEAELLPAHRPKLDGIQQKSRDSPFSPVSYTHLIQPMFHL